MQIKKSLQGYLKENTCYDSKRKVAGRELCEWKMQSVYQSNIPLNTNSGAMGDVTAVVSFTTGQSSLKKNAVKLSDQAAVIQKFREINTV